MTYKNMINGVLRRLREDVVTNWDDTDYSTMIGDLVNDSIALVQAAHNWSALFTEIDVSATQGTQEYTLTGLGEMGQVYDVYNDTLNNVVPQWTLAKVMRATDLGASGAQGPVVAFAFKDVTQASDDPDIVLWNVPDSSQTITFHVKQDQGPLSSNDTEIKVPTQPVLQYAWAYAREERGEGNFVSQFEKAKITLANYVSLDLERHPELGIWEPV